MNSILNLQTAMQFEQIQFEVERLLQRVQDPVIVADYLIANCIQPDSVEKVVSRLDQVFLSNFPNFFDKVVFD